jgi:hypothetical protein
MRRAGMPHSGPVRGGGIGMFAGNEGPPQEPSAAVAGELKNSLMDQPGIRLAQATGRRIYFGGAVAPQLFTRPPSPVNEDAQIRAGIISNNTRRTVGRARAQIEEDLATEEGPG